MILFLVRFLVAVLESFHDHYLIRWRQGVENAGRNWHIIDAVSWLVMDFLVGFGFGGWRGALAGDPGLGTASLFGATFAFFGTGLRLSVFALVLNKINGHDEWLFHLGDGPIDSLLQKLGPVGALIFRFVYLGASILSLVIVWT